MCGESILITWFVTSGFLGTDEAQFSPIGTFFFAFNSLDCCISFCTKGLNILANYPDSCLLFGILLVCVCRNLPFGGRVTRGSRVCLLREEGARSHHQWLFKENVGKIGTCGLRTLIVKGSRVVLMQGEGISTPRVHHKGRQPSIKCANMTSKTTYFPFLYF